MCWILMGVCAVRLRKVREERGLSQAELARRANVAQRTISGYELGTRKPKGEILVRIARVLGVSSAYLMEDSPDATRESRLPPEWEQTVEDAMSNGHSPEDVRRGLKLLRVAMGLDQQ